MFDMQKLLQQAKEVQRKVEENALKFKEEEFSAESGAGLVKVTANGSFLLTSLHIQPELLQEEKEIVEDLVKGAVNNLLEKIIVAQQKLMAENLPSGGGDFLKNLMG